MPLGYLENARFLRAICLNTMLKTRTISIFIISALIVSLLGSSARAATDPTLELDSVDVTGGHTASISFFVDPNGADTTVTLRYSANNIFKERVYRGLNGNSPVRIDFDLINLVEGADYDYRLTATNAEGTDNINGGFTTLGGSSSSGDNSSNTSNSGSSGGSNTSGGNTSGSGTTSGNGGNVLGSSTGGTSGTGTGTTSGTNRTATFNSASRTSVLGATTSTNTNPRPSFISMEYSLGNDGAMVLVADNLKPKPGEEFSYAINYKNDSQYSFNESNLKVIIPAEVEYIGANTEAYKVSGNVVEFNLGTISPGEQGSVVIIVKVKETTKPGTNLIFTSVLGYKDSKGAQLATTSYLTVKVDQNAEYTAGTASIFDIFSGSATIWLIVFGLLILVSLMVYGLIKIKNARKTDEEDIFGMKIVPPTVQRVTPPAVKSAPVSPSRKSSFEQDDFADAVPDVFQPVR